MIYSLGFFFVGLFFGEHEFSLFCLLTGDFLGDLLSIFFGLFYLLNISSFFKIMFLLIFISSQIGCEKLIERGA
jgi:hypothetical protein